MKHRAWIFVGAFALYAVLMSVAWTIGTRQAREKTEMLLDYGVLDLHSTLAGAIDTMLGHVARTAVRHIGEAKHVPMADMSAGAKELDIDEVNVVNRKGEIIASNDPCCMGVIMAGDPVMDEFMALTNGITATVSQPFRPHARNPKFRAKYLAAAFPGGDGFVQVGLEERRLAGMLPGILGYIFDEWLLGESGFFLCADLSNGVLVSNPSRHRDEAKTLSETGFDTAQAAPYEIVADGKTPGTTFIQNLFGEKCYCRSVTFCGHRFVAALPDHEYYDTRTIFVSVFGGLLFAVLGAFAFFIDRVSRDSARLKKLYTADTLRRAREMNIAKTVQTAALPAKLPDSPSYSIYASMRAATDVGGDFYDYFTLDASHIAFLVADVSGKGITAALYMMTAKTMIKDTLIAMKEPAAALTKANSELCASNPANMFLTAWVGVLDLETGVVEYANAGHNPPVLINDNREFVTNSSGPVLAFVDDIKYKPHKLMISPGDALFLYTDGVTEALDASNALFGEERLLKAVRSVRSSEPGIVCSAVLSSVSSFSDGVPQADDITVLAVRYIARPRVAMRSFQCTQNGIASASAFLDEVLSSVDPAKLSPLHIVLDEACSNIVNHSDASSFEIEIAPRDGGAVLTFADDGKPYNPLAHEDPDTSAPAEKRPIGGLGIMIIKKLASAVSYRRANNHNFLTVDCTFGAAKKA